MADWQTLTITGAVIVAIVVLILRFKVNPVVALILGAIGLGLLSGLGVTDTVDTTTHGFGDIMYEVGLIIGWGVLMGAILNEMGAIPRLVGTLMKVFGKKGVPYALGLALGTALQAIFLDVMLVMSAPLARRIAPSLGRNGLGKIATAMAISLECGIVLMVPGFAAVALAGQLDVPLGVMLVCGLLVVVPTIVVSITIMNFFIDRGFWNPAKDEQPRDLDADGIPDELQHGAPAGDLDRGRGAADRGGAEPTLTTTGVIQQTAVAVRAQGEVPLLLAFGPMLVSLVLIGGGAFVTMAGVEIPVLQLISSPLVALLIGLLGTTIVATYTIGRERVEKAMGTGFRESGQILLLTGAGGSLAAVISTAGMGELLAKYFSASSVVPLLVVWAVAAILHVAVGSVTMSAITAAGILAPIAGEIGLNPVLIALAAGSGALFLIHVTSNTFWLLQSMLGQTTRGALKSTTVGVSLASVVALGFTLILSIFL
ncbi:GntP family permease [Microbacterium phosphatis]|uniref:GntP family permease n=1 Tax=Microbacterium phosphatis TaxID=3140248 RepID=UPI0031400762